MRDQPKWEGKQACPECGRVTYSFLHSCPGVPQRPLRHRDHCNHDWLDRPESDMRECLICGTEVAG